MDWLLGDVEISADIEGDTDICDQDPDSDKRKEIEERLLWKLDLRLLFPYSCYHNESSSLCISV